MTTIYHYILTQFNIDKYILDTVDKSFIDYNKEGIFGCFGYLVVLLAGKLICIYVNNVNEKQL